MDARKLAKPASERVSSHGSFIKPAEQHRIPADRAAEALLFIVNTLLRLPRAPGEFAAGVTQLCS
jgi:hypothetical protein